jgi:hypothetical protein
MTEDLDDVIAPRLLTDDEVMLVRVLQWMARYQKSLIGEEADLRWDTIDLHDAILALLKMRGIEMAR